MCVHARVFENDKRLPGLGCEWEAESVTPHARDVQNNNQMLARSFAEEARRATETIIISAETEKRETSVRKEVIIYQYHNICLPLGSGRARSV